MIVIGKDYFTSAETVTITKQQENRFVGDFVEISLRMTAENLAN